MGKIAVSLKQYGFKYSNSDTWVLKNANLDLHYGDLLLLTGLSGEGKSTLLASINGIIPHIIHGEQQGHIWVNDIPLCDIKPSDLAMHVGSVLQNADSQIINSTIEDEIAFGCENLGISPERIALNIEEASLAMRLNPDDATRTLSGGQKQKLITATTLAMGQKILVFDEPLANLDNESAHQLLELLKNLAHEGYAILLVEHRIDVVLPYANRVAMIQRGEVKTLDMDTQAIQQAVSALFPDQKTVQAHGEVCLRLQNVCYDVPKRRILNNISFDVYRNERLVILGENGCGKTTLLRLLSRLIAPTSGDYSQDLDAASKKRPKPSWFKKLGFVYQNPNYQLFMPTVTQEVSFGAFSKKHAQHALEDFHLTHLKERHPHSLSEGQKRRLTIAAVMAMSPEIILLDEPTVGQDYEGLKNIVSTLNAVHHKTKNTMITITHDYRCAKALADRIIWLKNGEIYKVGGPELADEMMGHHL